MLEDDDNHDANAADDANDTVVELLADEDWVRDALLAAVDLQPAPPVHTDLVQIVERGRRRARMQVLSASLAAVVLITGVALGATALGRLTEPGRVATAAGQPPLPVTTRTAPPVTVIPTPTMTGVCDLPDMIGGDQKQDQALPADAAAAQLFQAQVQTLFDQSHLGITHVSRPPVGPMDTGLIVQLAGTSTSLSSVITLERTGFAGDPTTAAAIDAKQYRSSGQICAGTLHQLTLDGMVVNEYLAAHTTDNADGPIRETYQRVELYSPSGVRVAVSEVTQMDSSALSSAEEKARTQGDDPEMNDYPGALPTEQLMMLAQRIAQSSG